MGEKVEKLYFMKLDKVVTEILIEGKKVHFTNHSNNPLDCAFGVKDSPVSIKDYENFLEDRCFPRTRGNSKRLLKDIGLGFYEPREIVEITHGVMFDDTYWVKFDGENLSYEEARKSIGL